MGRVRQSFFNPDETQENVKQNGNTHTHIPAHHQPPPVPPQPTHPLDGLVVAHVQNGNVMMLGSSVFDLATFWAGHNAPRGATGRLIFVPNPARAAISNEPERIDHSKCSLAAHDRLAAHDNQKRDSAGFMLCNANNCNHPIFWCSNDNAYHHVNPEVGCELIPRR